MAEERTPLAPHGVRAVLVDAEGNRIALHTLSA
jgi:predicted enzyme related to lactoylglutathione lyase